MGRASGRSLLPAGGGGAGVRVSTCSGSGRRIWAVNRIASGNCFRAGGRRPGRANGSRRARTARPDDSAGADDAAGSTAGARRDHSARANTGAGPNASPGTGDDASGAGAGLPTGGPAAADQQDSGDYSELSRGNDGRKAAADVGEGQVCGRDRRLV